MGPLFFSPNFTVCASHSGSVSHKLNWFVDALAGYLVFERDFGRAFEERGITFGVALAVEVFLVPGTFRSYSAFRFGMAFLFETLTSPLIPVTMALPTLQ